MWSTNIKQTSFQNLTVKNYGAPKETQSQMLGCLTQPHTGSFNYIIDEGLTKIVQYMQKEEFALPNKDKDRVCIEVKEVLLNKPQVNEKAGNPRTSKVYPAECRGRACTYRGSVQIRIGYTINGVEGDEVLKNAGFIPIMVKSDLCNLSSLSPSELIRRGEEAEELGGYFIVNGLEKIIRMLILPRRNYPMCIIRPTWKNRGSLYTDYGVTMRCVRPDQTGVNMVLHYLNNGSAMLNFNYQKEMFFVPVIFILRGLTSNSNKYIYDELVRGKEDDSFYKGCIVGMLRQTLDENLLTQVAVQRYIGQRFRVKLRLPDWYTDKEVAIYLFQQCICIHLSSDTDKFNLLVYMTQKLFAFSKNKCAEESADNPMYQEVLLSGHLYLMVIKEKLEYFLYTLRLIVERHANAWKAGKDRYTLTSETMRNALKFVPDLTNGMEYLLATGNLVSRSGLGLMQATGLTVVADKLNFLRYVSHFRCIHRGAFFAQMRTTSVRKLLPEAWGFLCPVHTPDGTPCGLMNHMTALCQITTPTYGDKSFVKLLYSLGVCSYGTPPGPINKCYTVMLDGRLMGYVLDDLAKSVEQKLRRLKAKQHLKVSSSMEICLVPRTKYASQYPGLYIFTTPARLMRPVINLSLGPDQIEMIGTFEQVYMDICINEREAYEGITTHREPEEVSLLSFVANFTPFSDFNQSPRNMYQCQMGKQTMGTPCHALRYRSDNKLYRIQTPQTPLVRPVKHDQFCMDEYPLGTNAIVAVISYTGYDMEDAFVISKSSFERGFGHGSVYKSELINLATISKEFKHNPLMFDCRPDNEHVISGLLDVDGLPPVGRLMKQGEPYYSYVNVQTGEQKIASYKSMEPAYVDHIKVCSNEMGTAKLSKVYIMLRINRNPVIGDKFASRHGQKGVCSMMYPVEDMPFTESGMTPDIIFNPHGYPSRMTIGMMIESMAGKAASSFAECYDATPFNFSEEDSAIDHYGNMLVEAGYNYYGTERLYSGVDGRELEADIFMGVVYYQRLRHMVSDKFQVRTTGAIDQLTHQPIKGRKRGGGVRFGEMERDALISHGTSFLLQDRLLNCSDKSMKDQSVIKSGSRINSFDTAHLKAGLCDQCGPRSGEKLIRLIRVCTVCYSSAVICTKCGSLLSALMEKPAAATAAASFEAHRRWKCMTCQTTEYMQVVAVPYVFRYLVAELAAMNIRVDLDVKG